MPTPPARPSAFPSSFTALPPSSAAPPNPYGPPPAVPTSEYGPVRDIYDPAFEGAQFGGALAQENVSRELPTGRLTGLETRSSRRRRTIVSGVATALAVVLVVGLIAYAVWQTQQGDDGGGAARGGVASPPAGGAPTADGGQTAGTDDGSGVAEGDVAANPPGAAVQTPTPEGEAAADDGEPAAAEDDEGGLPGATDDPGASGDGEASEEEDAGSGASDGPTPTPTPNPGGRSLINLVPSEDEVPDGLILTDETELDEEDVAATFSDPEEALAKLEEWGWRRHLQRVFGPAEEGEAGPDGVNFIVVSVHRFDSEDAANEALTYFSDAVIALQGLQPVEVEQLGDESIALTGNPDAANLVVLYVRTGPYLVRIGASSPGGDPTGVVVDLAETILVNEPDEAARSDDDES
jgi:hypothetical protein